DVARSGIGVLFRVTQVPPSTVGSAAVVFADAVAARLRPMMATRPLAATEGRKVAALTTPLLGTVGGAAAGGASGTRLRPDSVSTNAVVPAASRAMARPRMLRRCPARAIAPGPSSPDQDPLVWKVETSTISTNPASVGAAAPAVTGVE